MATKIDVTGLTLNAKENPDFGTFVVERIFEQPALNSLHRIITGVKMKEQVVLASQLGKTGIKDTACARPDSGAESTLTEKFWEPANVGDTLIHCQPEVNALFKAYYEKINNYREKFDITGSDEELFLMALAEEAAQKSILRLAWLGDQDVAIAEAGASGLVSADDVKYYDAVNGLWKSLFAGVATGDVKRYTIDENAETTKALQTTLADGRSLEILDAVYDQADVRLRNDPDAIFYVSREIFDNYRKYLRSVGESFTIEYTTEGFQSLKYNRHQMVNMETIWELYREDFTDNTTNNAYDLPNRIVFSTPDNLPLATLNEGDMSELEAWYERKERQNYLAYGFTLDAMHVEDYMASVAY